MNIQPFFGDFPVIDLGDIILREIRSTDAAEYFYYMSHDTMASFVNKENRPQTLEKAEQELNYWGSLFATKRSIYWAIAEKSSDKLIGTAGFNAIYFGHDRADISYDLSPDYWGKGIMLKSVKAVLKYADYILALKRIQGTVITDNVRSINLLERCGFSREGVLKSYEIIQGEHKDFYMYARVA